MLLVPPVLPGDRLKRVPALWYSLFLGNWSVAAIGHPESVAARLWSVSIEAQF